MLKIFDMNCFSGKNITVADIKYFDESFYNSFNYIKNNDSSDLNLTFQVDSVRLGEAVKENLIQDGENIPVTEENKQQYLEKLLQHKFVDNIKVVK